MKTRSTFFSLFVMLVLLTSLVFQVTPTQAAPKAAAGGTVLILSTSVFGGAGSVEAVQAAALGFTVEMADAAQWGAKTQAEFATYRALILGDNKCNTLSVIQAAIDNRAVWGPTINGNIMLIGGDPEWHANNGPVDPATTEIRQSIAFAGDREGKTGLYAAFGCAYAGAPESGQVVDFLDGFGVFKLRGEGWNAVHKVVDHPALAGLDDATLSNWNTSTHAGFTEFPAGWVPVAIMNGLTGNGNLSFGDGSNGVPYMLGKGAGLIAPGDHHRHHA
jgi:hypothetical protein